LSLESELFKNPISAIYTPFSFILVYEVYLLIYYLPKSFTTYITKQYEIITLIIIRKLFKDLSALELSSDWFEIKGDLQFTYDILASVILFYLIFQFQKQGMQKSTQQKDNKLKIERFIRRKKIIAVVLVPIFFTMALVTLFNWTSDISFTSNKLPSFETVNNLFFDEFFTVLILVDVVLLLISFFYTDKFHKIIRNSGFVVSTILIRMSFGVSGLISTILIVAAVLFGLVIILIHNRYEKNTSPNTE
jgi:NADH:ubiquinone oxidoreductase subunit 6 (subunit J)